jgi:hypothetical protein
LTFHKYQVDLIDSQAYIKKRSKNTPAQNNNNNKILKKKKLKYVQLIKSCSFFYIFFFFNVRYNKIFSFHEQPFIISLKLPPNQAGQVLEVDVEQVS